MSSRLYPATKWVYEQVFGQLKKLGLQAVMSPLNFALMAVYIVGIILLEKKQTATKIGRYLPARAHDALNRLLRSSDISTTALFNVLVRWVSQKEMGYLCIDDVVVSKPYSKKCAWVGWTWSTSERRKVRGFHIVVIVWCGGGLRIPIAYRLWRPKAACRAVRYRKKGQLAAEMLRQLAAQRLKVSYVVGDTLYSGHKLCLLIKRLGWEWVGVLHPNTVVYVNKKRLSVSQLADCLPLKWRSTLGLRATSVTAYSKKYGHLRLVVTRNRHGNTEVLACANLRCDLTTIVLRKRARWAIETVFRDTKQSAALAACQCRVDQALVRHVAFSFLAFVVLQLLRLRPQETVGETQQRLRLAVFSLGFAPPAPLKGKSSLAELSTA